MYIPYVKRLFLLPEIALIKGGVILLLKIIGFHIAL